MGARGGPTLLSVTLHPVTQMWDWYQLTLTHPRDKPGVRAWASPPSPHHIPPRTHPELRTLAGHLLPWQLSYRPDPRNRDGKVGVSDPQGLRHIP